MVWVDQPVGVGYSEGDPDIEDEEQLATEFVGFWKNFVELFHMEEWRMYLTGESYAGMYIPYIAGAVRLMQNESTLAKCADMSVSSS